MEREKKECILRSAASAFAKFGFKKTSVEDIAKDAGVAKGTIYLACETKEDLFYQAVHREVRAWTGEVAKLIDPRIPADQLMVQCSLAGLQYIQSRPLVRQLLFGDHHLLLPEWHERLEQLNALGRANIIEVLKLGVKQGVFQKDLEIEEVAHIAQDFEVSSWLYFERTKPTLERMQKRMDVGRGVLMNGIRTH